MRIPDIHKECCCAACHWCAWVDEGFLCSKFSRIAVDPWNICPLYEESDE